MTFNYGPVKLSLTSKKLPQRKSRGKSFRARKRNATLALPWKSKLSTNRDRIKVDGEEDEEYWNWREKVWSLRKAKTQSAMESKISSFHPNHKALRVDSAGNPAPPPPPPFTGNFLFIPPLTTPKSPTPPIIYNILYIQFKPIKISKKKKKLQKIWN